MCVLFPDYSLFVFQVKIWFQNRRARERRDRDDSSEQPSSAQSTSSSQKNKAESPSSSSPTKMSLNKEQAAVLHSRLAMLPPGLQGCHPASTDPLLSGFVGQWPPGTNPMLWPMSLPAQAAQLSRVFQRASGGSSAFSPVVHAPRQF